MDDFLNHIKAQAARINQGTGQTRMAVVSSVDPASYTVRVLLQPENVLSGWLPVASVWVGAGWGMVCSPSVGDQVIVLWQEGDAEHGIIIGRLWSSAIPAPSASVGELLLVHQTGTHLKFLNDGSISSSSSRWNHTGDLYVDGDVYDSTGSLSRLRSHYNQHVHPPQDSLPTPTD